MSSSVNAIQTMKIFSLLNEFFTRGFVLKKIKGNPLNEIQSSELCLQKIDNCLSHDEVKDKDIVFAHIQPLGNDEVLFWVTADFLREPLLVRENDDVAYFFHLFRLTNEDNDE